ncbi:hypothetical protein FACS1894184_04770 [Clostridia bacterium]|nr:hypothetical protein FACS1894184_04770 [Clostridia bacterium]
MFAELECKPVQDAYDKTFGAMGHCTKLLNDAFASRAAVCNGLALDNEAFAATKELFNAFADQIADGFASMCDELVTLSHNLLMTGGSDG